MRRTEIGERGSSLASLEWRRCRGCVVCGGLARGSRPVEVAILLATQIRWKSGGRILSLALLGGITLSPVTGEPTHATQVAPASTAQTWLSIDGPWLCRTWSGTAGRGDGAADHRDAGTDLADGDGLVRPQRSVDRHDDALHAASGRHSDDGRVTSEMPGWVPDPTGEMPPSKRRGADSAEPPEAGGGREGRWSRRR